MATNSPSGETMSKRHQPRACDQRVWRVASNLVHQVCNFVPLYIFLIQLIICQKRAFVKGTVTKRGPQGGKRANPGVAPGFDFFQAKMDTKPGSYSRVEAKVGSYSRVGPKYLNRRVSDHEGLLIRLGFAGTRTLVPSGKKMSQVCGQIAVAFLISGIIGIGQNHLLRVRLRRLVLQANNDRPVAFHMRPVHNDRMSSLQRG